MELRAGTRAVEVRGVGGHRLARRPAREQPQEDAEVLARAGAPSRCRRTRRGRAGARMPRSALPSLVQTTTPPVSARSEVRTGDAGVGAQEGVAQVRARARSARACGSLCPAGAPSRSWKSAPTSCRRRWIAGITMWLGGSPRSCTIRSPRSVSTTSMPWRLEVRVQPALLGEHRLALHDPRGARAPEDPEHDRRCARRRRAPSGRARPSAVARCSKASRYSSRCGEGVAA